MSATAASLEETIVEVMILRGTADGIRAAAEEAEDEAQKGTLSQEDAERELRMAELLINSCQKLTESVVSTWDKTRALIRAHEVGGKDLLTVERILKRFFDSGNFTFTTVRGLIRHLEAHQLNPHGVKEFASAARRFAAAQEQFNECYADIRDPRLQESIQRGFEEAMRATGEPWAWEQELFG